MKQLVLYTAMLAAVIVISSNFLSPTVPQQMPEWVRSEKPIEETEIDTIQADLRLHPQTTYAASRAAVAQAQKEFRRQYTQAKTPAQQQAILDTVGKYLTEAIVNQLIPHWYGTSWSFEGYTEIPQKGNIACGYLVSTVLAHAGFNLNRYKMAQQDPWCEVQTLHQQKSPIVFPTQHRKEFADSVETYLPDGLYMLGMNSHVGMLLKRRGSSYLIHSSYLLIDRGKAEVTIEKVAATRVIFYGSECLIGAITTNPKLLRQWVLGEPIAIVYR